MCVCMLSNNILDKLWCTGVSHTKKHLYHPVVYCTYWPVMIIFNNWNIMKFTNKTIYSGDFDDIYKVVLDDISKNMASLMQAGKY